MFILLTFLILKKVSYKRDWGSNNYSLEVQKNKQKKKTIHNQRKTTQATAPGKPPTLTIEAYEKPTGFDLAIL